MATVQGSALLITQASAHGVGAFILSEGPAFRSRNKGIVTIASNVALRSGTLLRRTETGVPTPTAVAAAGNTGNGTVGTLSGAGGVIPGKYKVTFIEPAANLGAFQIEDPLGVTVGHGNVGTAASAGGLTFTIADGSTDFISGDQFTITVQPGTSKYVRFDPDTDDQADAVLYNNLSGVANGDFYATIFVRDCEVIGQVLPNVNATAIRTLAAFGIIVRY